MGILIIVGLFGFGVASFLIGERIEERQKNQALHGDVSVSQ